MGSNHCFFPWSGSPNKLPVLAPPPGGIPGGGCLWGPPIGIPPGGIPPGGLFYGYPPGGIPMFGGGPPGLGYPKFCPPGGGFLFDKSDSYLIGGYCHDPPPLDDPSPPVLGLRLFYSSSLLLFIDSRRSYSSNSSSPKAVFVISGSLWRTLIAFFIVSSVELSCFLSSVTLSGSPSCLVRASFLLIYAYNSNWSLSWEALTRK